MILTANQVIYITGLFFAVVFAFGLWLAFFSKPRAPKDPR